MWCENLDHSFPEQTSSNNLNAWLPFVAAKDKVALCHSNDNWCDNNSCQNHMSCLKHRTTGCERKRPDGAVYPLEHPMVTFPGWSVCCWIVTLKLCLSRTTSWPKEALFYLLAIYLSMNSIQPESQRKWLYHWKKTTYFILRPLFTFQRVCQRRVNLELLEDTVRVGIWKADYIIPIPSQWFKHKPIYYNLGFKWGFSEIRPCLLSFTGASLLWSLTMAETWEV